MFYGAEKCCKIKLAFGLFGKGDFGDKKTRKALIEEGRIDANRGSTFDEGEKSQTRRPKITPKKGVPSLYRQNTGRRRQISSPQQQRKDAIKHPLLH